MMWYGGSLSVYCMSYFATPCPCQSTVHWYIHTRGNIRHTLYSLCSYSCHFRFLFATIVERMAIYRLVCALCGW